MANKVLKRNFYELVNLKIKIEEAKNNGKDTTQMEEEYYTNRNEIVEYYLKLAYNIANLSFFEDKDIPEDDRKQMAVVLLLKAVDSYEPSKHVSFSAYGGKYIFFGLIREIYKVNTSIPAGELITVIKKIEENFMKTMGIKASFKEICKALDITEEQLKRVKKYEAMEFAESVEDIFDNSNDNERIINNLQDGDRVVEINGELYDEDGNLVEGQSVNDNENFGDIEHQDSIQYRTAEYHELQRYVKESLENLTPFQREIIERIYGLNGEPELGTVIAKEKGSSKQNIHVNKNYAINKLSKQYKQKKIDEYADYEDVK